MAFFALLRGHLAIKPCGRQFKFFTFGLSLDDALCDLIITVSDQPRRIVLFTVKHTAPNSSVLLLKSFDI